MQVVVAVSGLVMNGSGEDSFIVLYFSIEEIHAISRDV